MKCMESWLFEWVKPDLSREALCSALTMAGLEVEDATLAAEPFDGVVVGEIKQLEKHPEADRLNLCKVDIGTDKWLNIVCGARIISVGMKVPVATLGAILPNQQKIVAVNIRGADSEGMLCTAAEIGMAQESEGLLVLPADAQLGLDVRKYFNLDDYVIDVSVTPNRGDCLSMKGMAREIAAITGAPFHALAIKPVVPVISGKLDIKVSAKAACPHYVGRGVSGIYMEAPTPLWMKERLRRPGIRSINIAVDITNYILLELGQPMHAFDLSTIEHGIEVRLSKQGERIGLLDGSEKELDGETLVVADHARPLAIAGVMGGLNSSVTLTTTDILLESAYFSPEVVARQRQYYALTSDSSYRFERGVDAGIQVAAMERATHLLMTLAGGQPGPLMEQRDDINIPRERLIELTKSHLLQLLGVLIPDSRVESIFDALGFKCQRLKQSFKVTIPTYRPDIQIPEDLIEEVARLWGYNEIPEIPLKANLHPETGRVKTSEDWQHVRLALSHQGYHEIISYSFVDSQQQQLFDAAAKPYELLNPITSDMSVMRTNLLPGLVNAFLYNTSRQQHRVRLFEMGDCFNLEASVEAACPRVGGLVAGLARQEQWGDTSREVDFHDVKGDICNLLSLSAPLTHFIFRPSTQAALHPGQSADIFYKNDKIGFIGSMHPSILQVMGVVGNVYVFEIKTKYLKLPDSYQSADISKFPEVRRD